MVYCLKIIGYYKHSNFGDEQYKTSITQLFSEYLQIDYTIEFIDCDCIYKENFYDDDIIIVGGGDILNPYFMDKIGKKFRNRPNIIIGLSVGLPYASILVQTSKLEILDYIFIRTIQDLDIFTKYFHKDRIFYIPDVSYLLTPNYIFTKRMSTTENTILDANTSLDAIDLVYSKFLKKRSVSPQCKYETSLCNIKNGRRLLGICLSRHFYNKNYINEYSSVINGISKFVTYMISKNYSIVFIPFNTNPINDNENDTTIAKDVLDKLDEHHHLLNIEDELTIDDMNYVMSRLDMCIPMRFHSVLFCMYNMIPFVSVYSTRKIHNLLLDTYWDYKYVLKVNDRFVPTEFDSDYLIEQVLKLENMIVNRKNIYHKLLHINTNLFGKMFFNNISKLIDIITNRSKTRKLYDSTNVSNIIERTCEMVKEYSFSKGYNDFRTINDSGIKKIISSIVSYNLIGTQDSEYNYGIQEKMFDMSKEYDYNKEWKWIINDHITQSAAVKRKVVNNPTGLFNMDYIDQIDYSGVHRSGWQYVYNHLECLHNSNSELLLDLYVDRTFHWNREINSILNIIPYRKNWIGFIHHTFDTSFSSYNCDTLLDCEEFLQSLYTCKGLFVLSSYLQTQLTKRLRELDFDVKVFTLVHPTETNVKQFSYKNFFNNENKRLVHVGGWLRNIYSFYNLHVPEKILCKYGLFLGNKTKILYKTKSDKITKTALIGKNMNNYYPQQHFLENIFSVLKENTNKSLGKKTNQNNINQNISQNINENINANINANTNANTNEDVCQNISQNSNENNIELCNNWSKHFYDDICDKIKSVDYIEYLDNDSYDVLMTENIIFINLVDASAVNTVIECIVRSTPIIINKHPAVVELLGEKYPLYFNNTHYSTMDIEINNLLSNDKLIRNAHNYLKSMDKNVFYINTFVNEFHNIITKL